MPKEIAAVKRRPTRARLLAAATFAEQLVLRYDGASVSAHMDRNPGTALAARAVAWLMLDAATRP